MSDAPELKPCPFCGSNNVKPSSLGSYVCCENCDTLGPSVNEFQSATEAWNTRADLPQIASLIEAATIFADGYEHDDEDKALRGFHAVLAALKEVRG